MLLEFIIAFAAAFAIYLLIYGVKTRLLSPVPKGQNMLISTVIAVNGPATELENTVKAVEWLRISGRLDTEIVVRNCGMDPETAAVAGCAMAMLLWGDIG